MKVIDTKVRVFEVGDRVNYMGPATVIKSEPRFRAGLYEGCDVTVQCDRGDGHCPSGIREVDDIEFLTPLSKLRDELPREFFNGEYEDSKAMQLIDEEVAWTHRPYQTSKPLWPGPEKNVNVWWELANGWIVGFNENPSRGWSFPARKA